MVEDLEYTLTRVAMLSDHVREHDSETRKARKALREAMGEARDHGHTFEAIGRAAGTSRQNIYEALRGRNRNTR